MMIGISFLDWGLVIGIYDLWFGLTIRNLIYRNLNGWMRRGLVIMMIGVKVWDRNLKIRICDWRLELVIGIWRLKLVIEDWDLGLQIFDRYWDWDRIGIEIDSGIQIENYIRAWGCGSAELVKKYCQLNLKLFCLPQSKLRYFILMF